MVASRPSSRLLRGLRIGVLYGGMSAEREVSLLSGQAVVAALRAGGLDVEPLRLDAPLSLPQAEALEVDLAFLALHGRFGEDGRLQALLEKAGLPYTGSGPDASAAAFDKIVAKQTFERAGVCTPVWLSLEPENCSGDLDLAPPVVVKPAAGGSSLGVTIVRNAAQIPQALERAFRYDGTALVERYIPGRELTVAVLDEEPLPVIEIRASGAFFDYRAKYQAGAAQELCPAPLGPELTARAQAAALAAHRALGCRDVSRTDLILDREGRMWVLEVNTLPGLTSTSLLPQAAAAAGIPFGDLCARLLALALRRARSEAVCGASPAAGG